MMENKKIKVYVADDHNVVRKGMMRLLGTFSRVGQVKEAANGKELLNLMADEEPDAVILDVEMPVMGGVETGKRIGESFPNVKMLILTMHTEEVFINKLVDIGIHGYLSKSAEPEELERALYSVVDRDFYKNEIFNRAIAKSDYNNAEDKYSKLTTREIEILLLICQELTSGEISERLKISEKTFFNHRSHILTKTGARGNVGLIRFALRRGLINV